jgi:6-phosphogluconolactonase (cycloisomerase 2 family)
MENPMRMLRRALASLGVLGGLAAIGALAVPASPAGADPSDAGAVYVLSNQPDGNAVIEYVRHADGRLTPRAEYDTGGLGTGGGLGSQGAVIVDGRARFLYAVNPGSNSISSFRIRPDGLHLVDVVASGGTTPTSITVHRGLLYALNAGGTGNISGFTVRAGDLQPLPGSTRPLSGDATQPAQVSFTPDGRRLIVTERATNLIDVFPVGRDGIPGAPTVVASAGVTPFGFGYGGRDHLVVSEAFGGAADASAVSSYDITGRGLAVVSPSVPTTETAACWIATTGDGRYAYAGNAGTNSVTGYLVAPDGSLTRLTADGKTGSAAAGVTDLAVSRDSGYLYARLGNGTVGAWAIGADGRLAPLEATPGLPPGAAGIAAH